MCGIFGYIGKGDDGALRTLRGLKELEYRGYDSWGIAVMGKEEILVRKSVGKISLVSESLFEGMRGSVALGHSRWATHGGVTPQNAHPHLSRDGTIAVVHNGIIENHAELKDFLVQAFATTAEELFDSETDTEVIPHLIEHYRIHEGLSVEEALVHTAKRLTGRFAFVVMVLHEPALYAVRDGSPLVLGEGDDGYYVASDVPAFLDRTDRACYVDDRQYVRVTRDGVLVRDLDTGKKHSHMFTRVPWDKASATKEGYPHYMLKEMFEQAESIDRAIRQDDRGLAEIAKLLKDSTTLFLGCGTAAKVALVGQYFFAELANVSTRAFAASEDLPYRMLFQKKTTILAISQSGETADTLETLKAAKKAGVRVVALLNVVGSSMDRMADRSFFLNAGPEKAVASTKAATAQLAILLLLAHAAAGKLAEGKHLMRGFVRDLRRWFKSDTVVRDIRRIAEGIAGEPDVYIIGRGVHYPIALESAIKIQEVSYIHAEGFAGGELKHGPIALVRAGTPCIAFVPNDHTKHDMESNIAEVKSRGAKIIGVAPTPHALFDEWIPVPDEGVASPIMSLIPVQLLAYHLAVLRGNDPDMPRNLAKSVTVK